jgi:hypothetical protein
VPKFARALAAGIQLYDAGSHAAALQPELFLDAIHLTGPGNAVFAELTKDFVRGCATGM